MKIIEKIFNSIIEKTIKKIANVLLKRQEHKRFILSIDSWCNEYINKNDSTIVSSDDFAHYMKYYHLKDRIISFYNKPNKQLEENFLDECYNSAEEFLIERNKKLNPDDVRCIREIIIGIFKIVKDHYEKNPPKENISENYILTQNSNKLNMIMDGMELVVSRLPQPQNPQPIIKTQYPFPDNTIPRKISLFKDIQENSLFFLYSSEKDMLETCLEEKHIVLLGEAGTGKSIAIQQLAALACETEYYPLIFNLNMYTSQSIDEIIDATYPQINRDSVFLIFDAFDEIEEDNRNSFARKLLVFIQNNPDTIVLVSSRNNFYSFADDDGTGGLLTDFKEYGLYPIARNDIRKYIEQAGISIESFYQEASQKGLSHLIEVPFYLRELVSIFKKNNALPHKSQVMKEIIQSRFFDDRKKYSLTTNLSDNEYEIFSCLKKLSFAMQMMNKIKLSNIEYQQVINESNSRNLIKYSGVFTKGSDESWTFEHNNFREYLAAEYLNCLSINDIQELIFNNEGKCRKSWANVLSFLVLIREQNDLLQLLIDNDPEMVVSFEQNRVDEELRSNIVIGILESFANRNMWLSFGYNNAYRLATFGQSKDTCKFLLTQISEPKNFRAQSNAIRVLSSFNNLCGMETQVRSVLFECIKSKSTREYEKVKAMEALVELKLDTDEIAAFIINSFTHDLIDDYKLGILEYIKHSKRYEDHIDLFIEELRLSSNSFSYSTNIRINILDTFAVIRNYENVCKIIKAIGEYHHPYSSDEKAFESIISKAIEFYNSGKVDIFNTVFSVLPEAEIHNREFFKLCVQFFDKTGTRSKAFISIADTDPEITDYKHPYLMRAIGNEDCYRAMLEEYILNPYKYEKVIIELSKQLHEDDPMLAAYAEALETNGVALPKREAVFDYEKARNSAMKRFFECLFDRTKYLSLVQELVDEYGTDELTFGELKNTQYHCNFSDKENYSKHQTLFHLYCRLTHIEENDDKRVLDIESIIKDWDFYLIYEIYLALDFWEEASVTESQRGYIEQYCRTQLSEIGFSEEVYKNENEETIFTYRTYLVVYFSSYFNFEYDKETYLNMLFVPPYRFYSESDKAIDTIPQYLHSHLTEDDIKSWIRENVSQKTLCWDAFEVCLKYCLDNKLDWAVEKANIICSNGKIPSWLKRRAIEYLDSIKGYDYIYDRYLNTEDLELFQLIVETTIKHKNDRLRLKLEEINSESDNPEKYLNTLIILGSKYGLKKYYEITKKSMSTVNLKDETSIDPITDSISLLNNPDLIEEIGQLRKLLFTPGFVDKEVFGLYNSLFRAYQNIAKKDYSLVRKHLLDVLATDVISDDEKGFCNTLLADIEEEHNASENIIWSIEDIKEFFKSH